MPVPTPVQDAAVTGPQARHVIYLHGFASSAQSSKAAYFAARLRECGVVLETPDFNAPDFSTLTITRMVDQVLAAIAGVPDGPVALMGSSLGAFVAVQVATRSPRIDRLVLLAPAVDFGGGREITLGDRSYEEWRRTGVTNVFHYGFGRMFPVRYELYADACGYDCLNAWLTMPIQVFQGRKDTVVDPSAVEAWAAARPNVQLRFVDDDHQLGSSLEFIWDEMARFLDVE